jgi:predicted MFS family arabinose efflux permease
VREGVANWRLPILFIELVLTVAVNFRLLFTPRVLAGIESLKLFKAIPFASFSAIALAQPLVEKRAYGIACGGFSLRDATRMTIAFNP